MKLAILVPSVCGQGAEFVAASLARGLSDAGHDVEMWLTKVQDDRILANPEVKPFPLPSAVKVRVLPSSRARYNILAMRRLLKRTDCEAVMVHASNYAVPLVLASLGLRRRPKLINVVHSGGIGLDRDGNVVEVLPSWRMRLLNWLKLRFDLQIAVSDGSRLAVHRVSGYPFEKIARIYNPVVDNVLTDKSKLPPQHPWLRAKDKPVFVAAGAFQRVKHYELLIEAFALLRKHHDARLVIFGEGPYREKYEQLIVSLGLGDCVSLPGYTNQLPAEISAATAFVVSSYVESFSNVLVESLACGTPVVSVDAPYGPREILADGKNGILVKNRDVNALFAGLCAVVEGKAVRPTPEMVSRFTVEHVIGEYERVISDLLAGG